MIHSIQIFMFLDLSFIFHYFYLQIYFSLTESELFLFYVVLGLLSSKNLPDLVTQNAAISKIYIAIWRQLIGEYSNSIHQFHI